MPYELSGLADRLALSVNGGCAAGTDAPAAIESFVSTNANQRWIFTREGGDLVSIANQCPDPDTLSATDSGLAFSPANAAADPATLWSLRSNDDGTVTLISRRTGLALADINGAATQEPPTHSGTRWKLSAQGA